jgi:FkbM family methyltransferase
MNERFKNVLRRGRWLLRAALGRDYFHRTQTYRPITRFGGRPGSHFGAWATDATSLSADSIVYSAGVGDDISFDLALIERYGLTIHAIDPTPAAIEWLAHQHPPKTFILHPYALGGRDATTRFFANKNPDWISHSMLQTSHTVAEAIEVPLRRLATLMRELGHDRIDLLKLDIEGAEYEVIDDLLASRIPIGQLLVEFHHRFEGIGPDRTRRAVRALNEAGFRSFHVSAIGEEYSFIRDGSVGR